MGDPRGERVDLTDEQRAVLERYQRAYRQAQSEAKRAGAVLNDLCAVLAGDGFNLHLTDDGVELYRARD